ncbi:hypothetical protein [Streptomyces sp. enrichment culture]|uniref:hypothetical protein n=1 Tax=Streptomyces sp. enrichment culture TaxID=1795815 RepID=UPI003F549397
MADQRQSSPDGPDAAGGPSVRRAVSLGPAAADPGPMLAPAARRPDTPGRNENGGGGTARPAPENTGSPETPKNTETPDAPQSETVPARPGTTGGTAGETAGETATPAAASAAPASRQRQEPEGTAEPASGRARRPVQAESAAVGRGAPADGAADGAAAGAGADGPPSGNPKKPLLAAAGIAGVVLLAVPLLIWATDDSQQKKKGDVAVAAGSDTLLEEETLEAPRGEYAPAEPTPEPSTRKPSAKPSPVVDEPIPVTSPVPVSKPAETPKKKTEEKVEEHKAPRLPPNTAAYAVQRLAASHPGRHICYRVHVKGAGWTAPVCDGATAGREGGGRPVTAINVAVADAKRVNGNEFVQKDGWTTKWSGAADGTDLVLGSAASNAPNLSGFTIGVEAGNVCQNHKLGERGWGGLACESPQGWIFGGSTEPQFWLEAVRFTV